MKLYLKDIDYLVDFDNDQVNTLIIENQHYFCRVIKDLLSQVDGLEGTSVLSDKDIPVDISKRMSLITSLLPFEINQRGLLSKIASSLEKRAVEEDYYIETQELLSRIERHLINLTFDFSCDIDFSKLSIGSLIKSAGMEIRDDYPNMGEKLLDFFVLESEFEHKDCFVLINLRSYIDDVECQLFIDSVISHGYRVLLIENREYLRLLHEKRHVIDIDLCDIE